MRTIRISAASLFVLFLTAAVLGRSSEPTAILAAGEVLNYDVSWSDIFSAGRLSLTTAEGTTLANGHRASRITVEAKTIAVAAKLHPLVYRVETLFDTTDAISVETSSYANEDGVERSKTFRADATDVADISGRAQRAGNESTKRSTIDVMGALHALRVSGKTSGESLTIPIYDGTRTSNVQFSFGPRTLVRTGFGWQPGIEVTATITKPGGRSFSRHALKLWLSDDASRRPLRFEATLPVGTVVVTLTK